MRNRALKRGLAVSAVAALAVSGAQGVAAATSVNTQVGANTITLYSFFNTDGDASLKAEASGVTPTISLVAGAGDSINSVTFQYSLNGGGTWTDIQTVNTRDADGTFSYDWPATGLVNGEVSVRAVNNTTTPTVTDTANGVVLSSTAESVELAAGGTLGYFVQPYGAPNNAVTAAVSGTTSATTGNVAISRRDGAGAIAGSPVNAPVTTAQGATTGTFKGILDITGYPFDTATSGAVNQIVVGPPSGPPP
ncbi:hypothetical protein, partial [Nocardioides sp. R-C-SC26]|uniref:hypothetical protein n=1 Tax=Nocardioides sp. R-C-SC26 TaxID=2870414 RepID=UPI001E4D4916